MEWRPDFEDEEWRRHPLPKTYPCKYCSDYRHVLVKYMFDGWKGWQKHVRYPDEVIGELLRSMDKFFRVWLDSHSKNLNVLIVCTKCGYHLLPIEVRYTEEEKEALRKHRMPTDHHVAGTIIHPDGREEVDIIKAVFLPRGFKRCGKNLEPLF